MKKLQVSKEESNQKLEKYIRKSFKELPLSYIYKLFRKRDVKVNGKRENKDYVVQEGDIIEAYIDSSFEISEENSSFKKVRYDLDIVYEDENVLFVNKKEGVLVHEGDDGNDVNTLNNQVVSYLIDKGEYDPSSKAFIPSPAHRLDRNTSGIIMYGKNIESLQCLFELLKSHENISKYYLTLVHAHVTKRGIIEDKLLKDEKNKKVYVSSKGLEAKTIYRPLKFNDDYSLLEVELLTGRTHQIRVHLSYHDMPIVGDSKYGDFTINKEFKSKYGVEHQFLCSYKLYFKNIEGKLGYLSNREFKIELDKEKKKILEDIFD